VKLGNGLVLVVVGALALVPRIAWGQDVQFPSQLAPSTRAALIQLADSLRAAGLPVTPLVTKASEGVFKHAPDDRILAVARTLVRELGEARDALGSGSDEAEIVAGAAALHVGVRPTALRRLRATQPPRGERSIAVAIVVLTDLVSRRVPLDTASSTVETVLARGGRDADYLELRRSIEADILAGRDPASAASARARSLGELIDARRGRGR
jgi:hypothetical protein